MTTTTITPRSSAGGIAWRVWTELVTNWPIEVPRSTGVLPLPPPTLPATWLTPLPY